MINWIKSLFSMKSSSALDTNKYFIEKYKDFDTIIATKYQMINSSGKLIDIDQIVNPLKIDNRQLCAPADDQGSTSACAAYSICNLCEALIWKKTGKLVNLNAEQVYARAKQIDGNLSIDGTYLECAIKAAFELGGFGKSSIKIGFMYGDEKDSSIETIKFLLHKYDFLHVGVQINESWYDANNKKYVIEDYGPECGGHALLACGYDEIGLYIQNSWSSHWGSKGFAIIPWNIFKRRFLYACYLQGSLDI